MNVLAIAVALLGNQTGFDPDKALARLAPLMVSHKQPMTNEQFTKVLAKAGCQAKFDEKTKKQYPGFVLRKVFPIVKVAGLKRGSLVTVDVVLPEKKGLDLYRVLFYLSKGRPQASIIEDKDNEWTYEFMPKSAVYDGRSLICAGLIWNTSMQRVRFATFRPQGQNWIRSSEGESQYECGIAPTLRLSSDRKSAMPVEFESYGWLSFVNALGTGRWLPHRERWAFKSGRVRLVSDTERETPMNTLDGLYDAMCHKDKGHLRKQSANKSIYHRLLLLSERVSSGDPNLIPADDWNPSYCRKLALTNLGVWFHFARKNGRWVVEKLTPYKEKKQ